MSRNRGIPRVQEWTGVIALSCALSACSLTPPSRDLRFVLDTTRLEQEFEASKAATAKLSGPAVSESGTADSYIPPPKMPAPTQFFASRGDDGKYTNGFSCLVLSIAGGPVPPQPLPSGLRFHPSYEPKFFSSILAIPRLDPSRTVVEALLPVPAVGDVTVLVWGLQTDDGTCPDPGGRSDFRAKAEAYSLAKVPFSVKAGVNTVDIAGAPVSDINSPDNRVFVDAPKPLFFFSTNNGSARDSAATASFTLGTGLGPIYLHNLDPSRAQITSLALFSKNADGTAGAASTLLNCDALGSSDVNSSTGYAPLTCSLQSGASAVVFDLIVQMGYTIDGQAKTASFPIRIGVVLSGGGTGSDTTPPTLVISAPSSSLIKAGATTTYTVTYSGADSVSLANANVTFTATSGAATGCTAAVSGTGTTTRVITVSGCSANGVIYPSIAAATASDTAGNTAASANASANPFTVDVTAPTITISSPTVVSVINSSSNLSAYAVSGACENGLAITVSVTSGATTVNPATQPTCSTGTYSTTVNLSTLADGTITFNAAQTDAASNAGSASVNVTKDVSAPSAATTLAWSQSSPANTTSLTASWTKSASTDLSSQSIQFYSDASCTTTSGSASSLSSTATSQAFTGTNGSTYTYKITSLDAAGNSTASSCSSSIAVDTTTTEKVITYNPALNGTNYLGGFSEDPSGSFALQVTGSTTTLTLTALPAGMTLTRLEVINDATFSLGTSTSSFSLSGTNSPVLRIAGGGKLFVEGSGFISGGVEIDGGTVELGSTGSFSLTGTGTVLALKGTAKLKVGASLSVSGGDVDLESGALLELPTSGTLSVSGGDVRHHDPADLRHGIRGSGTLSVGGGTLAFPAGMEGNLPVHVMLGSGNIELLGDTKIQYDPSPTSNTGDCSTVTSRQLVLSGTSLDLRGRTLLAPGNVQVTGLGGLRMADSGGSLIAAGNAFRGSDSSSSCLDWGGASHTLTTGSIEVATTHLKLSQGSSSVASTHTTSLYSPVQSLDYTATSSTPFLGTLQFWNSGPNPRPVSYSGSSSCGGAYCGESLYTAILGGYFTAPSSYYVSAVGDSRASLCPLLGGVWDGSARTCAGPLDSEKTTCEDQSKTWTGDTWEGSCSP